MLLEECTPGAGENFQRSPDQKSGENGTRELRRREKRINTSAETGGAAAAAAFLHFVRLPFYYMRTEENAHFYCKLLAMIRIPRRPHSVCTDLAPLFPMGFMYFVPKNWRGRTGTSPFLWVKKGLEKIRYPTWILGRVLVG
jgi:hypothetical protein